MIALLATVLHASLALASLPLVAGPAATAATATATAPNAASVVQQVQSFYAGIQQVTADFRQTVFNSTFGTQKDSDGAVYLAKPGKMRWDYKERKGNDVIPKKSFISDGTTLYVVDHDNKQVVKKNLKQDLLPVAVTFLYGKGNLSAEFDPEIDTSGKYGSKNDIVLKLTPKQPSAQYKALYLVVNNQDFHVSQSIIIDSSNNMNHFQFFAPDFQKPVKDSWFQFDPRSVTNYRVIDADQAAANQQASAPPAMTPSAPATAAGTPVAPGSGK
jgi:outer membrane lipoprotein carrier protein